MSGFSRMMKHTALSSGLQDAHIRPPALLNEFVRLSMRDAATFFGNPEALEAVVCPGCGEGESEARYEKGGFSFAACKTCQSLFVNPRPRRACLERYFAESEASRFRVAQFGEETAQQRHHHLLRGLASWMGQVVARFPTTAGFAYGDLRSYSPLLFGEVAALNHFGTLYSIDPVLPVTDEHGVTGVALAEVPPLAVLSAWEKLEHQQAPLAFLNTLYAHLAPGGLLFLTTRTCSGFDLQVLGEKAPYIFVPEHLNLLSIAGLHRLVQRSGFDLIELSTPGQLDVEMVLQACSADPSITLSPFVHTLLTGGDQHAHRDFQLFLQKHRLSSHVRLALRKPEQSTTTTI